MQSHYFAFQASSLRFGLQCWWFCGVGLIGPLELPRWLGSAMWAFFLLFSGAEMSTSMPVAEYDGTVLTDSSADLWEHPSPRLWLQFERKMKRGEKGRHRIGSDTTHKGDCLAQTTCRELDLLTTLPTHRRLGFDKLVNFGSGRFRPPLALVFHFFRPVMDMLAFSHTAL
ncbi:hypothetical protein JOB18_000173 [Solea senegalensis]|uniref:Secreted protein n=1 Tax=Solea senegalensis TaxID=28829 RepID=A0AAV6SXM0_SOLSE|nr:hypothetical protein JOB18_000173 [Solea senegalensis]